MFCYLRIAGATQVNSDGAGLVWQAWDMLHGNVLLHGWWATDVSFYTTELPEYAAVTAVAGVRPEVVHICSALTYTLLVLLAAFVARGRARGAEGVVRALLAAGLILAPQPTGPPWCCSATRTTSAPGCPCWSCCCCSTGPGAGGRWWVPVAAAALLAWSIIGDPLIEVVGVAPLFVACVLRAGWIVRSRRRTRRAGQAAGAAARGVALAGPPPGTSCRSRPRRSRPSRVAAAGNWLIRALGGYTVASPWYHLQSLQEIVRACRSSGRACSRCSAPTTRG